jgi:hypothetical protein
MLILKEEIEKAAGEYADKHSFRVPYDGSNNFYDDKDYEDSLEGFEAGANFVKDKVQEYVGDIIIENQGLKLYKDNEAERFKKLAIGFAEYCALEGWIIDHDGWKNTLNSKVSISLRLSSLELFEMYFKEINNE